MKLSTKGRYGLKAMFQLSIYYGEGPTSLNIIAKEQNLSESYLEQLFSTLRKEELIISVRGAQGGYMLSKPPKEITVGNILRSLEGDLAPSNCIINNDTSNLCENEENCVTKLVWLKIKEGIDDVIDGISLQDMIDDKNKLDDMIK